ncbi:MAG: methyltransferase family protein [Candidatus Thorarchaeota archaeon]|jgi:protein-S-isoprenylcysteine O-methyltransferase Ste14
MLEYLVILLGVSVFGVQHSGISALRVKGKIIDRWGKDGYSRLYNYTSIVAILIAFFSMWYWDWLYFVFRPSEIQPLLFISGLFIGAVGAWIAKRAAAVISVSTVADMRTDRLPELITDGLYSRIRHPLYLATILFLIALALIYPFGQVITFSGALVVYTLIGAYLEERKLIAHYGDEYLNYKRQAGFVLPRLRQ